MKQNSARRGFTLIELLVVVLIIAILAAIALPQYQKVVEKSRISEAIVNLDSVKKAISIVHLQGITEEILLKEVMERAGVELAGGTWDETGILINESFQTKNFEYSGSCSSRQCLIFAIRTKTPHNVEEDSLYLLLINADPPGSPVSRGCFHFNNATSKKICAMLEPLGWESGYSPFGN